MPKIWWSHREPPTNNAESETQVDEQSGLPVELYFRTDDTQEADRVTPQNPFPVRPYGPSDAFFNNKVPFSLDYTWRLAMEGRIFYGSDAAAGDLVLGQTSFAATTPTFLLRNPTSSGVVCIPLGFWLNQTGSVAGAAIDVIAFLDKVDRYSSGGTNEGSISSRPLSRNTAVCSIFSNPTATAAATGAGKRIDGVTTGPDVSPAEGALQQYLWTPTSGIDLMDPGSALLVYTYAGSTGPSWFWTFKWAEVPVSWLAV